VTSVSESSPPDIAEIIRLERACVIATLIRLAGNIDNAEDAFAEATIEALKRWPDAGIPTRPGAWLTTVARRKALDTLRRESKRSMRETEVALTEGPTDGDLLDVNTVRDDSLRLFFICCHPALPITTQVSLALRLIGGLTTAEIAHALLESEVATSKRITRGKAKIAANNIAYRIPADHELPERLHGVLNAIALIHTTGHHAPTGPVITRADLTAEALRLTELLARLMPDEPECLGLHALLVATAARASTRTDTAGQFVPLPAADRSKWNRGQASEARSILERALRFGRPGPFQLQAAISCLHSLAPTFEATDWPQICELYDRLEHFAPSTAVSVNRAVALAQRDGPEAGLSRLDQLAGDAAEWTFFHVACGHLHGQLGNASAAKESYETALRLTHNDIDRAYIEGLLES
jgi:RNA polymerase sigma-70 factor, ECF subfamily